MAGLYAEACKNRRVNLSRAEQLLLEVARGTPSRRRAAWAERRRLYPLQTFPSPADQLLSLVAVERLEEDDDSPRLRQILEETWRANQAKIALARILGDRVIWLGDLALLFQCYRHAGQRPLQVLEALVQPTQLLEVSGYLERQGFELLWRSPESAYHRTPGSNFPVRLVTQLLPNRAVSENVTTGCLDGLRLLNPELLLLRLCLARPHNAWWLADFLTLVPKLEGRAVHAICSQQRAGLAVRRMLRRINRFGLEPVAMPLKNYQVYPGEWFEALLGESRLSAHLLPLDRWSQLPVALLSYLRSQ